ncbi:MAG: hypothetical protein NTV34_11975, partial [Proteobacteria bacterium]|nr:hypothetical protein [Pseudomonadota bacterium]
KNGFRTFYSECPVIDVFSIYPYYAELSGLIEIEIARQMAKAGEIPATAKGLIICSDIFGNTSFLEFRLNEELN